MRYTTALFLRLLRCFIAGAGKSSSLCGVGSLQQGSHCGPGEEAGVPVPFPTEAFFGGECGADAVSVRGTKRNRTSTENGREASKLQGGHNVHHAERYGACLWCD